jgi:hypothetical protein
MPKWFDNENFGQRLHKRERESARSCLVGCRLCVYWVIDDVPIMFYMPASL